MRFDTYIDKDRDEIIDGIRRLVRIKSVEEESAAGKPFGEGPYRALSWMLQKGEELGFSSKNHDGYAGHIEYGDGNETVGILVHVDVVPEGEGWTRAPYSAEIEDGRIYGRGSYDDKGACLAALYALRAVKESRVLLKRKIRIIIGANEETGMQDIPYYLKREAEPVFAFSPDAPFPVVYGEKGILEVSLKKVLGEPDGSESSIPIRLLSLAGGRYAKVVPAECTAVCAVNEDGRGIVMAALENLQQLDRGYGHRHSYEEETGRLTLTIVGKEAYATKPEEGLNAVTGMMHLLSVLPELNSHIVDSAGLYMEKIGMEYDGASLGIDFYDDISTPLTFNVGTLSLSEDVLEMRAHIRYPILTEHEEIFKKLKENLEPHGIRVNIERLSPPHFVEKESFLVRTLMDVYREITADASAEPVTMTGGTYARTLKNAAAFGPLFPGEKQVAHGPDEYVNIESIITAAKIYAKAMYELAK